MSRSHLEDADGGTIFRAIDIYLNHFGPLLLLTAIPLAPVSFISSRMLIGIMTSPALPSEDELLTRFFLQPFLAVALEIVAHALAMGAVTLAVGHIYLGKKPKVLPLLLRTLTRFGSLIGISIAISVRTLLGFLLFIVPGIVWTCSYALTGPALMTEDLLTSPAMRRSASLARGRRWEILWVLIFFGALIAFVNFLLGWISGPLLDPSSVEGMTKLQILSSLLTIVVAPSYLVALCLLYYDARIGSEDFDLDVLSREILGTPHAATVAARLKRHAVTTLPADLGKTVPAPQQTVDCGRYSARMSWRSVTYVLGGQAVHFCIEPMTEQDDIVFIPDDESWRQSAPDWATEHRDNMVAGLRAVDWNRGLEWRQSPGHEVWSTTADETRIAEGSLEATSNGRQLESQGLFHPQQTADPAQVKEAWLDATRRHIARARGLIKVDPTRVVTGSVFAQVELASLMRNPRVEVELAATPAPPQVPVPSPPAEASSATSSPAIPASPSKPSLTATATVAPPAVDAPAHSEERRDSPTSPLKAADLFIKLDPETKALLLEDWRWLVGKKAHVFQITVFGDIFTVTPEGRIHRLDTGHGVFEEVAQTSAEWKSRLPANAAHWLRTRVVRELRERGLQLAKGQVYSWLEAPMQGGQELADNVQVIDAGAHVRQMAAIARRQRG